MTIHFHSLSVLVFLGPLSMADLKSTFLEVYSVLKSELLSDPAFEFSDDSRQWVERVCRNCHSNCSIIPFSRCLAFRIFLFLSEGSGCLA